MNSYGVTKSTDFNKNRNISGLPQLQASSKVAENVCVIRRRVAMPVFHTKTIQSILDPVAQQVRQPLK